MFFIIRKDPTLNTKYLKSAAALAVIASLAGCGDDEKTTISCDTSDSCVKFTIMHTNDNHGRFWENDKGEYGMAARKTLIEQIRTEVEQNGGLSLLLSGGDINTGVPESDLQDAEPDFRGMNLLGYDAMAVGNHEFDNPRTILDDQRKWADFPMLAANIYKTETGERLFKPYKVFELNGLRIAVIGLTTDDTKKIGNPEYVGDLTFVKPQDEIQTVIDEINDNNLADVIFATTHMGHYADGNHGSNAPGDVLMARSLEEGQLQAIFGGHSQNPVCMEKGTDKPQADYVPGTECLPDQQKGTWIMQAHEWGKYVGRADFEYYNNKLHLIDYQLIPVNLKKKRLDENGDPVKDQDGNTIYDFYTKEIKPDLYVKAFLKPYQEEGEELLGVKVADLTGRLEGDRNIVRQQQTNLGRLIASAHYTHPNINADFGIMNSGGVRDSMVEGDVTYRDILTVQPFGNELTVSEMTGAEITTYLNDVATKTQGSGAYAQFANINMTVDCQAKTVEIHDINTKGYDADTKYKFTIPKFNAVGGDGYPVLDKFIATGLVDADVLKNYFQNAQTINAEDYNPQGEIVYIHSASLNGCAAE